ncbi:MAG: nucleotidyltransferase domain-containing protein [Armatimonadota bacterium]
MSDTESAIEEMVRRIVEAVHPDKIILFGSHARGEAGPDSDVDLMVIAPSDEDRAHRLLPVYGALRDVGVAKDVVWWTQEEIDDWRNVRGHFINRVLRDGKVLYERSA